MGRGQPAQRSGTTIDREPGLSPSDPPPLGVVLAGGLAKRLGGAKASVQLGGRALISYPLEALAAAGLEAVVIAKADTPMPELDVPIWIEGPELQHPAHGIATALERAERPIVVCACDAPFLTPSLVSMLAKRDEPVVVLESDGGLEPLPGRYSPAVRGKLEAAAGRGDGLQAAVGALDPVRVTEAELSGHGDPTRIFLNVNTQGDLSEAEALLEQPDREQPRPGGQPSERVQVLRRRNGEFAPAFDSVAVEEPLEIRVNGQAVAVTMRTPGSGEDTELALGFLHGEGITTDNEVARVRECRAPEGDGGLAEVDLRGELDPAGGWQRQFYATSSCGICGKASIDAVRAACEPVADGPVIDSHVLDLLPDALRDSQRVFERTGGLHAAGIFTSTGELIVLREDVGRHNAVDKVIGRALMRTLVPLREHVLLVSGRASFEIVQKAVLAGVPILAAVSAPSSLATRLAEEANMTLIGFLRPGGFNVYTHPERVQPSASSATSP